MEAAQIRAMAKALEDNFQEGDAYENLQFYYHSDHLGSSSYITNLDGEVVQHVEYVPFGEVFIEERNNIWNTPYLFNAKEFDEETGLYYYGARYYDPKLSLWMSTDPLEEKYPNFNSYSYVFNNPIRFIDPNGEDGVDKFIGYTIGTITNLIPGTSGLRDVYHPRNSQDYNNALRISDNIALGAGLTMIGAGATGTGAGTSLVVGGGAVSVSGIGAPVGATASVAGAVVITGSGALIVGGTTISLNATKNKHDGYNRGSSVSQGSSGATQSTNGTITFKQGQGGRVNQVTVKIPKGYRKTNMRSNDEPIFTNGKNYITPDNTGHNGGIWKMAKTIKGLGKKETRMGTYDRNLKRIGD